MAYNNGSSEDAQNWPFSVRYTASPYRKSKFPAENPGPPHHPTADFNYPPNNPVQHPHFQLGQHPEPHQVYWATSAHPGIGNSARGFQHPDTSTINNNNVQLGNYPQHHLFYQPSYQQYCYLQQQQSHFHPPHPEGQYGLPLPFPSPQHQQYINQQQYFMRRNQRTRYPPTHLQQFLKQQQRQMDPVSSSMNGNGSSSGVVDEGYIEDLKQTPSSSSNCLVGSNSASHHSSHQQNPECDPYSYVYDSKLLGESQNVGFTPRFPGPGTSILERLQREAAQVIPSETLWVNGGGGQMTGPGSDNNGIWIDHTVSSGQYPYHNASENEYEEIRDVARYMSMDNGGPGPPSPSHHVKGPPLNNSTAEEILAEVVQVQQGHDRVLDQLNLDVENLLLRYTNEIESHSYSNVSSMGEVTSSKSVNHHHKSVSMDSGVKVTPQHHNYSNTLPGSLWDLNCKENFNDPCDCRPPDLQISHGKSKSETCAYCCPSGGGGEGSSTFGRKKKLDRASTTTIPFSSSQNTVGNGNKQKLKKGNKGCPPDGNNSTGLEFDPGTGIGGNNGKNPKARHHRSYSIIPHWKIRDQLMRLPFLKHREASSQLSTPAEIILTHYKLKKTESCNLSGSESGTNQIPTSGGVGPGFLIPTSISSYTLKKKKGQAGAPPPKNINSVTMAAVKARSSSVDELRVTGQEEHWYSADSDTEDPDSFTALPSELSSQVGNALMAVSSNGLLTLGHNNPNPNNENGSSRLELSTTLGLHPTTTDHVPKAPKFRRGSGIKDKWRESWTGSKTLLKSNMEEENRLLRWFSLRKNHHGGSTTTVDGGGINSTTNRNSTLPQLSEEDLKRLSFMEDEEGYWPRRTVLPPTLPVPPPELSPEQITRRHIVAAIVHSENNYVSALQRLVNEYKKPLECSHPVMLSHSKISIVFHRVPEILQCHSLFRIALAEYIRKWDSDEKIGDVFVASFSKSLVLDVYSEFINNFGQAMETAKSEARRKSGFAEFLKVKQMTAHDRLSLFGLMVKPVQRFPQFILLLQDLLKHTPKDHHDRMSLQLALTQLESLAAMLNERKRESEQYQAFRETIKSIGGGKFVLLRSITDDPNRILLRQDPVTHIEFDSSGGTVAKSKSRKLLLLNDMLICVTSGTGTSSTERGARRNSLVTRSSDETPSFGLNGKVEKSVFKWSYPVREVEVEDISISPTMSRYVSVSGRQKSTDILGVPDEETQASLSLLEEMQSLMHDYSVLSRISELITTLKSSYEGLTESFIKELLLEIQHQIRCRDEQISYFDSSCLTLLLGVGTNREKVVFQLQSPAARNAWIEELRLAQLALDPNNSPGWDVPPESPYPQHRLPLFVRSLPLCRSPHLNTVKAGCFFTHTSVSPTGRSKILDYLWVSSTDGFSSHITAYRSQQNVLKEITSFDLMEEKINDLIFVSGHVWMGTESRKVMVFDPSDTDKGHISQCLMSESVLKLTLFENVIYAGLADGILAVFTEIQNPKDVQPQKLIKLGTDRIISVFGARDHIYASCGSSVVTIDTKTHTIERNVVLTHHPGPITHMACSGVGLWITNQDSGTVCLYHLESLQHLQDVSIAPSVFRTVRDSYRRQKGVHVTCLIAHKGWLWIGTNLGVVLTIPLPRLEGVPIISTGKANVSYHGYYGPITFLMPLTKPPPPALTPGGNDTFPNPATTTRVSKISSTPVKSTPSVSLASDGGVQDDDITKFRTPPRATVTFDEKDLTLTIKSESASPSLSNSSSFNESSSKPGSHTSSPLQSISSGLGGSRTSGSDLLPSFAGLNKTLVVLRKKNSRDNGALSRNCKTLPRGGPVPHNLRFSIDSDVYGLYGNLINVRGLEDEGRFVDPLYDALRRSDPELMALDAKINTLDRRIKMRMSRPRSLDLSNWSVDSKISASSDESVGLGGSRSSQATDRSTEIPTPIIESDLTVSPILPQSTSVPSTNQPPPTPGTAKKTINRGTTTNNGRTKPTPERTLIVVVGGRGYVNMKSQTNQDQFIYGSEAETKQCTHLTVWQMKT